MKLYTDTDLLNYLLNDTVLQKLSNYRGDEKFASHNWLLAIPAKRMIYNDVYGHLFGGDRKKVLDIGGGFCGLSRELFSEHDYTLIDTMNHDEQKMVETLLNEYGERLIQKDWLEFEPKSQYNFIIANDVFPNVDQRLELFIKKFRPFGDIILILTAYNNRFYKVKRIDADEIFTIQSLDIETIQFILKKIVGTELFQVSITNETGGSIFSNGRFVYKIIIPRL